MCFAELPSLCLWLYSSFHLECLTVHLQDSTQIYLFYKSFFYQVCFLENFWLNTSCIGFLLSLISYISKYVLSFFVPSPTQFLTHRWYSMNICWMLYLPPSRLLLGNTEILISKFKKRTYLPSSTTPTKVCIAWVKSCLLLLNLQLETYGDLEASHFFLSSFFPPLSEETFKTSLYMSRNGNKNGKKL